VICITREYYGVCASGLDPKSTPADHIKQTYSTSCQLGRYALSHCSVQMKKTFL